MTTPTDIDRTAPVVAHHEIDIAAPLERVWNLHTNVAQWPTWNAELTAAGLEGPFVPGSSFTWTSYDFTVTSTIYEVEDQARTLWGGAAQGSWAHTNGCSSAPTRVSTSRPANRSPATRPTRTPPACKPSSTAP